MSKFTEEQQAAVDQYKAEILRVAGLAGYSNEAMQVLSTQVLSTADRAFRESHASDDAAENYLRTLPTSLYDMVSYNRRGDARGVLKNAFVAGWDARGSQDAAEGESEPAESAETPATEEPKRRWF